MYFAKLNFDGSLNRFKARLVTLENKQEYEINYDEIFTPISKTTIVCTLYYIGTSNRRLLYQTNVKNSFLYDDLTEDIYTTPP